MDTPTKTVAYARHIRIKRFDGLYFGGFSCGHYKWTDKAHALEFASQNLAKNVMGTGLPKCEIEDIMEAVKEQ